MEGGGVHRDSDVSLCFQGAGEKDESQLLLLLRRPSWSSNKGLLLFACLLLLLCVGWLLSTMFWLHRPPSHYSRRPPPPPAPAQRPASNAPVGPDHAGPPSLRDTCASITESWRFDCYPERGVIVTRELCEARNCCFLPASSSFSSPDPPPSGRNGLPWCFYPTDFPSYTLVSINDTSLGQKGRLVKEVQTYYPADVLTLEVDVRLETDTRLHVKVSEDSGPGRTGAATVPLIRLLLLFEQIIDPSNPRFEVPIAVPAATKKAEEPEYSVEVCKQPFGVVVRRRSSGAVL